MTVKALATRSSADRDKASIASASAHDAVVDGKSVQELDAFSVALMCLAAVEALLLLWLDDNLGPSKPVTFLGVLIFSVCAWVRYHFRSSTSLALFWATTVVLSVDQFPATPNHHFLLAVIASALWIAGPAGAKSSDNARLVVLFAMVSVMIWSGVQKLAWGAYRDGSYLAMLIATDERFRNAGGLLLPRAELERLVELGQPAAGKGPYILTAPLARLVSWLLPFLEIGAGTLLLLRRYRRVACVLGGVIVIGIELVAREFSFGMMCLLCFLYLGRPSSRMRSTILTVLFCLVVVLVIVRIAFRDLAFY
jgi:hypothetical protein